MNPTNLLRHHLLVFEGMGYFSAIPGQGESSAFLTGKLIIIYEFPKTSNVL